MTKERMEEIKKSIAWRKRICESLGKDIEIWLQEEIDLYNYVIELENMREEVRKYIMKNLIPKNVDWEFDEEM